MDAVDETFEARPGCPQRARSPVLGLRFSSMTQEVGAIHTRYKLVICIGTLSLLPKCRMTGLSHSGAQPIPRPHLHVKCRQQSGNALIEGAFVQVLGAPSDAH